MPRRFFSDMPRLFAVLATLALAAVATALAVGLSLGDLQQSVADLAEVRSQATLSDDDLANLETLSRPVGWARVHRLTGLAAALGVVLVSSIGATYFIGTSRWCKEVVETYDFDPQLTADAMRRKRRAFSLSASNMLAVVVIAALGAAADPSTGVDETAAWAPRHLAGALVGIAWLLWSFAGIGRYINRQHAAIEEIMRLVRQRRGELGLEVS